jgi:hypothetical protein
MTIDKTTTYHLALELTDLFSDPACYCLLARTYMEQFDFDGLCFSFNKAYFSF